MPISRSHDGFIHILQVGRNDRLGFFYYVMEAGDDAQAGQQIDPATYAPRTLARELRTRGALPPSECRDLLLALSEAVEQLHQHRLVHRDIKPDNIIFVHGRPKLSDIDLVTDLSSTGAASCIGTPSYLAPEGPGSAAADVFSLGRVLYVTLTGKPPDQFPELPTAVTSHPDCVLVLALNRIACKAAEFNLERRYPTAARLHEDLKDISPKED
jgi:serine/threonine protein kinase